MGETTAAAKVEVTVTETKRALLAVFSDGKARDAWGFGAGTVAWAKRYGLIEPVRGGSKRIYTITAVGLDLYARVKVST
jgi:hypothetical protein